MRTSARRHRLADVISGELGDSAAKAIDPATVSVRGPGRVSDSLPDLLARIEPLRFEMDAPARVVINERTGTVVIGSDVRIGRAAVAHGNLSVRISTHYDVSQPNPLARWADRRRAAGEGGRHRGRAQLVTLDEGVTLDAVVRALNALGATPRDIIAIMQALKAAGALRAELVIM